MKCQGCGGYQATTHNLEEGQVVVCANCLDEMNQNDFDEHWRTE